MGIWEFLMFLPKLWDLYNLLKNHFGPNYEKALTDGIQGYQKLKDARTIGDRLEAQAQIARAWMPR